MASELPSSYEILWIFLSSHCFLALFPLRGPLQGPPIEGQMGGCQLVGKVGALPHRPPPAGAGWLALAGFGWLAF